MQIFNMKYGTYKIHNVSIMSITKRLKKFDEKLLSGRDVIVKILVVSFRYSQSILSTFKTNVLLTVLSYIEKIKRMFTTSRPKISK